MPRHPRIEAENLTNFTTTRTRGNELWLLCDKELEEAILGHLAVCAERYQAKIYAIALQGTHKHELGDYTKCNRAAFLRDLNSATARAVKRRYPKQNQGGGAIWRQRYSNEFVLEDQDVENQFFYTVLQPVKDGLVSSLHQYPGYNCFEDAIHQRKKQYKVVDWAKYNAEKRWKKNIRIKDYTTLHTLQFARLPGYENLSQVEYVAMMRKKLRERTKTITQARKKAGRGYLGREKLLATKPGSKNKNSAESSRWSFRPRIICGRPETSALYLKWYFDYLKAYSAASLSFRLGDISTTFPPGTYRPPLFTLQYKVVSTDLI